MSQELETSNEATNASELPRRWRPSRPAEHRASASGSPDQRIVQHHASPGSLERLRTLFARPTARLIVAISLFVAAVIVFDATINGGSWTERASKPKPMAKARPIHPINP